MTADFETSKQEHRNEIIVIVNGRQKVVSKDTFFYSEIVILAFENATFNDTTVFTVTFSRGHDADKQAGVLVAGDTVKVKKGMIFNVTSTDKS